MLFIEQLSFCFIGLIMIIEWIVARLKSIFILCFKTAFMTIYALFFEIWSLIIKYPKIWIGMLLFFLSTLLSIKHCKIGFFINYKEHIVNHNYPENSEISHRYFFNRKMLEEMLSQEVKVYNEYVKEDRKEKSK